MNVAKNPQFSFTVVINLFLAVILSVFFVTPSFAHHDFSHKNTNLDSSLGQPVTTLVDTSNDVPNEPGMISQEATSNETSGTSIQAATSNKQAQGASIFSNKELEWIKQNPVVTYGALTSWFPHDFIDEFGQHQGIAKDYLSIVSKKTGLEFQSTSATWSELLEKIQKGEIDLLPALHKNESRKEFMVFSRPYSRTNYLMFSKKGFKRNKNLKKQKVALTKGYAINEKVQERFPEATFVVADSFHDALKKLQSGEVDLIVEAYGAIHFYIKDNNIKDIVLFQPYDMVFDEFVYMGTPRKNTTLVSIIDKAIADIPDVEKKRIYDRWSTYFLDQQHHSSYSLELTTAEKQWLKANPVIPFLVSYDWKPYEYHDSRGVLHGINTDFVNLIDDVLPVKFDYLDAKGQQSQQQVQNSPVYFTSSLSIKDEDYHKYDYSEPLFSFPIVIAMQNDHSFVEHIEELQGKKIAVVAQLMQSLELENMYPMLDFYPVDSVSDGVLAVSTGKYEVFLDSTAAILFELNDLRISNVRIVGKTDLTVESSFAVPKSNAALLGILNKAIVNITQTQRNKALAKWGQENFKTRVDYKLVYIILSAGGILLMLGWYGNRSLAKQVALRNEEIEKRKESEQNLSKVNQRLELANLTAKLGSWEIVFPKNDDESSSGAIFQEVKSIRELSNTLIVRDDWLERNSVEESDKKAFFTLDQWTKNIENKEIILDIIEDVRASKGNAELEVTFLDNPKKYDNPNDAVRTLYSHLAYHNIDGVEKIIGTRQDITSIKKTEKALIIASKRAEDANKAKSEFLANMSHEIRTPLNVIMGYTTLLTERITDESHQKILRTVNSAGKHLLVLINDILDLSKIEAGKLEVICKESNIKALLQEISDIFQLKFKQKGLDFELILDKAVPDNLCFDEVRVRQILVNLIGNAIKFTHEGRVTVELSLLDINAQKDKLDLSISVTDTGIGMAEEVVARIFGKFEQADAHATRGYEGAGLGLAISRQLAEMMNGTLTAMSKEGIGSSFTLMLKNVNTLEGCQPNQNSTKKQHSLLDHVSANVLIVSENRQSNEDIETLLVGLPMVLSSVEGFESAIELIYEKMDIRVYFDLILIDFSATNVFETAVDLLLEGLKILKQIYGVPVLLVSDTNHDKFDRSIYQYIDGFMTKPIVYKELHKEITKFLQLSDNPVVEISEFALNKHVNEPRLNLQNISNIDEPIVTAEAISSVDLTSQKSHAVMLYRELTELRPILDNLLLTNDLSGTKEFLGVLQKLQQAHQIPILASYVADLHGNISSLDLMGIRNSLNNFSELIQKIKDFSEKTRH